MPRLLENLQPGTPVRGANGEIAGEVRAAYGSGKAQMAVYLLVFWTARGEETLIPTDEVMSITEEGVILRSNASTYADLPAFQPSANPLLHKL